MSKQTIYALVNCARIYEGTLKNALPAESSVISLSKEQAMARLFAAAPPPLAAQGAAAETSDLVAQAQGKISALLANPETERGPVKPLKKSNAALAASEPPVEPDCIIYQISDTAETDAAMVRTLRRKCAFRDVPIAVLTAFSETPRAQSLIALGADELICVPSKPEALQKRLSAILEPAGSRMPVITKVINPYISATVDLLSTMAGLCAEKKEVFLKKNYRLFGDISAIMSFTGKVEGEVVVCFEEALARSVVARIMASSIDSLTKDELREGIGEIVNIIAGNAKAVLAGTEYAHQMALPTVVLGNGHEISHPGNAPCIVVRFEVAGEPMAVMVSMTVKQ
jgi:chemotaxis protein CheX